MNLYDEVVTNFCDLTDKVEALKDRVIKVGRVCDWFHIKSWNKDVRVDTVFSAVYKMEYALIAADSAVEMGKLGLAKDHLRDVEVLVAQFL